MKGLFTALALWACVIVAGQARAEPVQVGDATLEMKVPAGFSEDSDARAHMHVAPSTPQTIYKVYVPKGGLRHARRRSCAARLCCHCRQ